MARMPSISGRYASVDLATTAPLLSMERCNIAGCRKERGTIGVLEWLVPVERIELPTFGLQNRCSTAELNRLGCAPVYGGAPCGVNNAGIAGRAARPGTAASPKAKGPANGPAPVSGREVQLTISTLQQP